MKAAAILAALVLSALAPSAVAGEVGQYAAVELPSTNPNHGHTLIVDTKNGYVWEWYGGDKLHYLGQAMPGKDSGPSGEVSTTGHN